MGQAAAAAFTTNMNLPVISDKTFFGQFIRLPLRLLRPETELPILQGVLRGKRWISGSYNHSCWLGVYEHKKRLVFEKTIRRNSILFDIGAHVGYYTLLSSLLVGEGGKVYSFEPLSRNLKFLHAHLRLNGIQNVEVIEAAVGDQDGVSLFKEGDTSAKGSLRPDGTIGVKTLSLDSCIAKGSLPSPDFMKIDVEGGEMDVLRGARRCLSDARPTIFLATHGKEIHRNCCELLSSFNYELLPLDGNSLTICDEILAMPSSSSLVST
jgi:FkbM family methyltransferase